MDEERIRRIVTEMKFSGGKGEMGVEDIARIQPGLAQLMPAIGDHTWKLYYAGKARNWPYALYQWKVARKLFEQCAVTRPKHGPSLEIYLREDWAPIQDAIQREDLDAFLASFEKAVVSGNVWHERKGKPFIVWKVPEHPPPDLDLTPRG
jgi:hypothetical protein